MIIILHSNNIQIESFSRSMKAYRFSTPVKAYKNFNGYNLPSYGEAIWHYPDGAFTYGKFNIDSIIYNTNPDR